MRNIVHIWKFVVIINLIIMFNPNIYLFSLAFLSVIAGGTLHFYSGVFVNNLFWYDYYGLRLDKKKVRKKSRECKTHF